MPNIPIYVKLLQIENVKTFSRANLDFERKDGLFPQWTLILGDNSIGKSSLLQFVAWMKVIFQDPESGKAEDYETAPLINDEVNETLVGLVRKKRLAHGHAKIKARFAASSKLGENNLGRSLSFCDSEINIWLDSDGGLKDVKTAVEVSEGHENVFIKNEIVLFAYSASRVVGIQNIGEARLDDTIQPFIAEKTELYDAQEILHTVNYAAFASPNEEKSKYKNFLDRVERLLVNVLPDVDNIRSIEIAAPKIINNKLEQGVVYVSTKHGNRIPFNDFSLGYKTVTSWVIDLAWRMFNRYPDSDRPLEQAAIVLIDEIDLHLHPVWQRQIIERLSKHFPNVQFIATAHSPIMVQAALEQNYAVLKHYSTGVSIINEPEGIDGWRIDQILTSEFFGLRSSRGIQYEKLLDAREKLIKKSKLTLEEKKRLKEVTLEIMKLPTGETPEEIENRRVIAEAAAAILKKKVQPK